MIFFIMIVTQCVEEKSIESKYELMKILNVMNYNYKAENVQYQIIRTNFCEKHFNNFF